MNSEATDEKEALCPQPRKRKKKRKQKRLRGITIDSLYSFIDEMEIYLISRKDWRIVEPVIFMMEVIFGMDGPPKVRGLITRVNKHFDKKEARVINHYDTIQGDKNNFQKGSVLGKFSSANISELLNQINQITKNKKNGKKRQNERRPQYVRSRKHDDKVLPE